MIHHRLLKKIRRCTNLLVLDVFPHKIVSQKNRDKKSMKQHIKGRIQIEVPPSRSLLAYNITWNKTTNHTIGKELTFLLKPCPKYWVCVIENLNIQT